ncbi:hypothetical protein LXL04_006658 [Taraxacum kok-saghyz]
MDSRRRRYPHLPLSDLFSRKKCSSNNRPRGYDGSDGGLRQRWCVFKVVAAVQRWRPQVGLRYGLMSSKGPCQGHQKARSNTMNSTRPRNDQTRLESTVGKEDIQPEKEGASRHMRPTQPQGHQGLYGKLTSLGRFIAKSVQKALPLFQTLKRAANKEGAGAVLVLKIPEGDDITYALHFEFLTFNNIVEYKAQLTGLHLTKEIGAETVIALSDPS